MASVKLTEGQSLLDVALWLLGDASAVFDLADANGLAITDTVEAGQVLLVPDSVVNADLVKFLAEKGAVVNTLNVPPTAPAPAADLIDFDSDDFEEPDFY